MKNIFSSKKGMTLVEVIVAVAIIGIVSLTISRIFIFSTKSSTKSQNRSLTQMDINIASKTISNELRYSSELEFIDPSKTMQKGYKYIYIDKDDYLIYRNMLGDEKKIIESKVNKDLTGFTIDKRLISYVIADEKGEYDISSSIDLINLDKADLKIEDIKKGVKYKERNPNPLEYVSERNQLWRDMVGGWYEGTIESAYKNYTMKSTTDTGELSLSIEGGITGSTALGAMIFQKIDKDHLGDANKDKYKITIDSQTQNVSGGWGILLNGNIIKDKDGNIKDNGYMFQFDPGAGGFLLRQIKDGKHDTNVLLGVSRKIRNGYSTTAYFPDELLNTETGFNWSNKDSSWTKRYKTEIIVENKAKEMLLTVTLIDENGNRSNEMKFGSFGSYQIKTGTNISGEKMDYGLWGNPVILPGDYIGLRSWNNSKDKEQQHTTKFYEIKIESVTPN